mmetsp:Transcript_43101/g.125432  ORF Transcript_43101/g.125432 Transcript_43101/m.125432 type:complete len:480 (+) Transcript_43101:106-1545(+)
MPTGAPIAVGANIASARAWKEPWPARGRHCSRPSANELPLTSVKLRWPDVLSVDAECEMMAGKPPQAAPLRGSCWCVARDGTRAEAWRNAAGPPGAPSLPGTRAGTANVAAVAICRAGAAATGDEHGDPTAGGGVSPTATKCCGGGGDVSCATALPAKLASPGELPKDAKPACSVEHETDLDGVAVRVGTKPAENVGTRVHADGVAIADVAGGVGRGGASSNTPGHIAGSPGTGAKLVNGRWCPGEGASAGDDAADGAGTGRPRVCMAGVVADSRSDSLTNAKVRTGNGGPWPMIVVTCAPAAMAITAGKGMRNETGTQGGGAETAWRGGDKERDWPQGTMGSMAVASGAPGAVARLPQARAQVDGDLPKRWGVAGGGTTPASTIAAPSVQPQAAQSTENPTAGDVSGGKAATATAPAVTGGILIVAPMGKAGALLHARSPNCGGSAGAASTAAPKQIVPTWAPDAIGSHGTPAPCNVA